MKFLHILFLINTLIVFTFWALLFTSESKTTLTAELTTEIPEPAAFKLIVKKLTETELPAGQIKPETVRFTYFENDQPVSVVYQLRLDDKQYQILFMPVQSEAQPLILKNIHPQITLKKLVDGSTSIQWQIHYQVPGWTARILNRFFWKPALEKFLNRQILDLQQTLAS